MKERKLAQSPNWSVRCISVPGPDTDLTLHVMFDSERYVIGCGEGTQRAFAQKSRQLKGIQAVLLPNAQARTRAGLPGMIMTLADAGLGKLNIIGTSDTAHYLATMRSCLVRDKFPVHAVSHPIDSTPDEPIVLHETPSITISGISLTRSAPRTAPSTTPSSSKRIPNSYETPDIAPDMHSTRPSLLSPTDLSHWRNMVARGILGKPFGRQTLPTPSNPFPTHDPSRPSPPASGQPLHHFDGHFYPSWPEQRFPLPLPSPAEQEADMVYFFQAPEVRGKLNVKAADAAGVPIKMRSVLTRGESVQVNDPNGEDGKRWVRPEECLEGGGPGPAMIVVSCSAANMDGLLASKAFHRYQPGRASGMSEAAVSPHVVVHRVEHAVLSDERYQAWMRAFGQDAQHLIADPTRPTESIYFRNSAWNATQLSILDPEIFHLQQPDLASSHSSPALPPSIIGNHLTPYTEVRMYPRAAAVELGPMVPKDEMLPLDVEEAREASLTPIEKAGTDRKVLARGVADREAFDSAVDKARKAISAEASERAQAGTVYDGPGADMRITTLGTGSAIPSKYRNVSATMLECPDLLPDGQAGKILLDCGEGTLGQMRRMYGVQAMKRVYEELRMVFVSHMHADHHLGLQLILEDRFRASILPFLEAQGLTAPLFILAPPQIALALQENASWQSRHIASDEALNNVFFLNSARFLQFPVTLESLTAEAPATETNGHTSGASDGAMAHQQAISPPNSEREDVTRSIFSSTRERAPRHMKGLLPLAAPVEWGQEDIARGTRRWPVHDVLGWSSEINDRQKAYAQSLLSSSNLTSIHCVQVPHRGYATALVLDHTSGWRVVYSGDTKPSDKLARLGKDATVLIHEATIEDGKEETAELKGHSTFGQAIEIGRRMGAKHVLLNHFSQRYPKLPDNLDLSGGSTREVASIDTQNGANALPTSSQVANEHAVAEAPSSVATKSSAVSPDTSPERHHPVVAMSFDFMSVKIRDMFKVAHYLEPIAEFYKDGEEESAVVDGAEEASVNGTGQSTEGGQGKKQQQREKQGGQAQQAKQPKQPKQPKQAKRDKEQGGQNMRVSAGEEGAMETNGAESEGQRRAEKRPSEESGSSPDRKRVREDGEVGAPLAAEQANL